MKRETYEIRVEGYLPSGWSDWFGGLSLRCDPSGDSILSGPLPDQAALHGVLARIRDLNLKLVSVTRLEAASHPTTARRQLARRAREEGGQP